MKYFVCSDIHSYYDEWIKALNSSGFDLNNDNHKLIICGDLFDRGHQPKQVIDYIQKNSEKIILIRGNHEDLMQEMIDRNESNFADNINGTSATIMNLCSSWGITDFDLYGIAKRTGLQDVLDKCINYFETEHHVFVHSWIPTKDDDYVYDRNWRTAKLPNWETSRWRNPLEMTAFKIFEPNKKIVFGHWNCSAFWHRFDSKKYDEYGENSNTFPFETENYIAIDACTAVSKRVNVIVIED